MSASKPPSPHDDGSGGNERRATRYGARLDARLLFQISLESTDRRPNGGKDGDDASLPAPPPLRLVGHTRNISETGLAFIVPTLRIGDEFAHVIGSRLLIRLYLPAGHVEIHATPVRYEQLSQSSSERGYLIGVRITEMTDNEWVRMVEYVRSLR